MTEVDARPSEYDMSTCTPSYLAEIDYYVTQSLYGHIEALCSKNLQTESHNNDYLYWLCFAQIQQQQYKNAYNRLSRLFTNTDYSLPSISLALQCTHISRTEQDKLRVDIKQASKTCTVHALAVAARYFVHINKLNKAKQCVEKALTKNKRHIGLIALYGLINIKVAEAIDNNTADTDLVSGTDTADSILEKGLLTCKKALKCSQSHMDICALISRVNGLTMQKKYDKAVHDINTTIKIHPTFIPAIEVKTQLLCATDQWSDAIVTAQSILEHHNPHCIAALRVLLTYSVMRSNGDKQRLEQFRVAITTTEPHNEELLSEYNEFKQRMQSVQGNTLSYEEPGINDLSDIVESQEEKHQSPDYENRSIYNQPSVPVRRTSLVKATSPIPTTSTVTTTDSGTGLVQSNGTRRRTVNINDATNAVLASQSSSNLTAAAAINRVVTPRSDDSVRNISAIEPHSNQDVNEWVRQQRQAEAAEKIAEQQRIEQKRYDELRRLEELDRARAEQRAADERRYAAQQAAIAQRQRAVKEQRVERSVDIDNIPTLDEIDVDSHDTAQSYDNTRIDTDQALPYRRPAPISTETVAQRLARNKTLSNEHFLNANDPQKYATLQRQPSLKQVQEQSAAEKVEADRKARIALAAQQIEQAKQFVKSAFYGETFMKYGRRGSPHERTLTVEVNGRVITLDWGSGKVSSTKDGIKLLDGKQTAVMLNKSAKKAKVELCFSLVFSDRTLDLECKTQKIKEYWWNGFQLLLKYLK